MSEVSKIFKPRRGTSTIMSGSKANTVLQSGEFFVEAPATGIGSGKSKIKIGDGSTVYSSLPYALGDTSTDPITYTADTSTTVATALSNAASGGTLANIVAGLKQAISLCNTAVGSLSDDLLDTSGRVSNLEVNFQDGVSSIVSAINAKAKSSLTGASTPEEIVEVVNNIKLGPDQVLYRNLTASGTAPSREQNAKWVYDTPIDISNWKEMVVVTRKTGSGWGNLPQGGCFLFKAGDTDYKKSTAYIGSSDGTVELSGHIDVSDHLYLKVGAYIQHQSSGYTQGIRCYIFYLEKE